MAGFKTGGSHGKRLCRTSSALVWTLTAVGLLLAIGLAVFFGLLWFFVPLW